MILSSSRCFASVFVFTSTLGLSAVGCSSADSSSTTSSDGTAAASSAESGRVQAYLDSLYTKSDVRHSFQSAMGDTIDCADFATAPGVRRLLAQGKSMDDIMAPIRKAQADKPAVAPGAIRGVAHFQGDMDENGHARSCPEGSYPHVRMTAQRIAESGGLDAFLGSNKVPPPPVDHPASTVPLDGGTQASDGYYAWVINQFSVTASLPSVQGGISTMTIAQPTMSATAGDHSVAQIWITGADHATGKPRQTIEAGWEATSLGVAGPTPAQLFVGTTNNAYATWCKNNNTSAACPAWIPNPTATLALAQKLPPSTPGGTQHELTITVEHQYSFLISCIIRRGCTLTKIYSGWGISASVDGGGADTYLGYYDNGGYSNDGTSGLSVGGDNFQNGGEVFDSYKKWGPPPEDAMGEGPLPKGKATYGSTAYHRDYGYYDANGTLQTAPSTVYNTNKEYVFDITTPPGKPAWTNYFYFGDYQ